MFSEIMLLAAGCTPQQGKGGGGLGGLLIMMVAMIGIMYFLVYRPQAKQRKKLQAAIDAMKKGDRVLTSGGLYGTVSGVKDNIVVIEISSGVKVEVNKAMVASVATK